MDQLGNTPENKPRKKSKLTPQMEAVKWKPGQSGNPSGRPKKKPITEMFEKMLENPKSHASIEKAIFKIFSDRSGIAKVMLLKDMAERVEGKVSQPVEVEGSLAITALSERMQKARERAGKR